jgi:hypothetical protein
MHISKEPVEFKLKSITKMAENMKEITIWVNSNFELENDQKNTHVSLQPLTLCKHPES